MREVVLATFNTHWGVRPDGRRFDLVAACRALDADVLVLQEHWRPPGGAGAADALAAEDPRYALVEQRLADLAPPPRRRAAPPAGTGGDWGIVVLSRLPVLARSAIPLPWVPTDRVRERAALRVRLDAGPAPLDLVAVHLSSRLPIGPLANLARLRPALPTGPDPAVVAGDFNFWGPGVQAALRDGWRRAVLGRTWPAHRPHSQIDHVLVNAAVEVVGAEVLPAVGSDHRPVRVRLRVRG